MSKLGFLYHAAIAASFVVAGSPLIHSYEMMPARDGGDPSIALADPDGASRGLFTDMNVCNDPLTLKGIPHDGSLLNVRMFQFCDRTAELKKNWTTQRAEFTIYAKNSGEECDKRVEQQLIAPMEQAYNEIFGAQKLKLVTFDTGKVQGHFIRVTRFDTYNY